MKLYDINVLDAKKQEKLLADYKGKVVLIVNTATGCGFTPQYAGLQALYEKYQDQGFTILDFPCNQFGNQAPGTEAEIGQFCLLNYNTSFPQFAKIDVNGPSASPLFTYLKKKVGGSLGLDIKWNFTKFLVDRECRVVKRCASADKPERLAKDTVALL